MGEICIYSQTKRVAAYARVSLETDRLSQSLLAQMGYYSEFVRSHPEWKLVGIYADSFISGTETSHRTEFNRLISECEDGGIDMVLCKSISRFARNTVDLLNTIRHLNALGIEVYFEKERINSLSGDGELLLTILASFAQEESRSISENVKWGIRKRFREGTAVPRNKRVYGYRHIDGKYEIQPDEAEIVRTIFSDYIAGVPLRRISAHLREIGAKTVRGLDFSHNQIEYIIRNEIYTGDMLLQKTFVRDFITHTKSPNRGELPQYRICGCHEPIISEEIFLAAQEESKRRAAKKRSYPFSGKLICPACGKTFTRRAAGKYVYWHCRSCENITLREDKLSALFNLNNEKISAQISEIIVCENGELNVKFKDGRHEKWQYK